MGVLLLIIVGIVAITLVIMVVSFTARRLSDNTTRQETIDTSDKLISAVLADPELTAEQKQQIINSITGLYATTTPPDDSGGFDFGNISQTMTWAIIAMVGFAAVKTLKD